VSRKREELARLEIKETLDPLFNITREASHDSSGPMVLCQGDQSRRNIVLVDKEWVRLISNTQNSHLSVFMQAWRYLTL
jgi:hypothetical protein